MAHELFISYSRRNLGKVKEIKNEIEHKTCVECWMDLNAIESGTVQFTQDITEGIKNSIVFLFMLSKESQESEFALKELNLAMKKAKKDKEKHVVIVNIDGCEMCDEFELLCGLSDIITWDNLPQREKMLRDVIRWTQQKKKNEKNEKNEGKETIDEFSNEKKEEIKKLCKIAGYVYFFAALAYAFLPNVFYWNNNARIELSMYNEEPSLWLYWLPIVVSLLCSGLLPDKDIFSSSSSDIRETVGDKLFLLMTGIPCFILFVWLFIKGLIICNRLNVGDSFFSLFTGPVICVLAWCIGLYFQIRMRRMTNSFK